MLGAPQARGEIVLGAGPTDNPTEAARQAANLALSQRELGDLPLAGDLARRALELDAGYAAGHDALGCVLLDQNQVQAAADAFGRACALAPDDVAARLHLARAQHNLGLTEQARASLRTAIVASGKPGDSVRPLGLDTALLVDLLPKAEALPLLYRITTADPGQLSAWINLTLLLRLLDQTDAAVRSARGAINAHPGDGLAWSALSGALQDAGEDADALAAAEKAVRLAPDIPEARSQLVAALCTAGEPAEAAIQLTEALRRWPDSPALCQLASQLRLH